MKQRDKAWPWLRPKCLCWYCCACRKLSSCEGIKIPNRLRENNHCRSEISLIIKHEGASLELHPVLPEQKHSSAGSASPQPFPLCRETDTARVTLSFKGSHSIHPHQSEVTQDPSMGERQKLKDCNFLSFVNPKLMFSTWSWCCMTHHENEVIFIVPAFLDVGFHL